MTMPGSGGASRSDLFGRCDGVEVANKDTFLSEVDQCLGHDKPPLIEFIFVEPSAISDTSPLGSKLANYGYSFGHATLRYSTGGSSDTVVLNICNPATGNSLVNTISASDYFASLDEDSYKASEQYGIYGRSYFSVRLEGVTHDNVKRLEEFIESLRARHAQGSVSFNLTPFHSWAAAAMSVVGGSNREAGNCAEWIGRALVHAGVLKRARVWPKALLVDILLQDSQRHAQCVEWRRARHADLSHHSAYDGFKVDHDHMTPLHGPVAWLDWLSTRTFWHTERRAHCTVSVPPGELTAVSARNDTRDAGSASVGVLQKTIIRLRIMQVVVGLLLCMLGVTYVWSLPLLFLLSFICVFKGVGSFVCVDMLFACFTLCACMVVTLPLSYVLGLTPVVWGGLMFLLWWKAFVMYG
eukprot:TRINITY_DN1458_c0_g1_i2.p1 TRINITY_DN1458_c0_g1~~TRINITY_DN1458_c0_g1_i2.p1  ORF type:complete len:411 (+),score=52.84 TRINITY_DN1458_c0_g1_i2:88-1320(+)